MRNLLLFIFMICCISAKAQFDVYPHNFNTDGIQDWTLVDHDGNGTTWTLQNNEYNTIMAGGEAFNVLHLGGSEITSSSKSNWAILPVQDMSFYSGTKLKFTYLKGFFACEASDNIKIYVANTPNVADMLANGPIATVTIEGDNYTEPPVAITKTVNIPATWNTSNVYFAIAHTRNPGDPSSFNFAIELTQVVLTADNILSVDDIAGKTATIIKQNPVAETLQLQLGSTVNTATLSLQIYNLSGMLVKEAKYNEAGISVSNLAGGMYFVVLNDGYATERLKFIKK